MSCTCQMEVGPGGWCSYCMQAEKLQALRRDVEIRRDEADQTRRYGYVKYPERYQESPFKDSDSGMLRGCSRPVEGRHKSVDSISNADWLVPRHSDVYRTPRERKKKSVEPPTQSPESSRCFTVELVTLRIKDGSDPFRALEEAETFSRKNRCSVQFRVGGATYAYQLGRGWTRNESAWKLGTRPS